MVHERSLTLRVRALGRRVADVVALLRATDELRVCVGVFWLCVRRYPRIKRVVSVSLSSVSRRHAKAAWATYNTRRVRKMLVHKRRGRELLGLRRDDGGHGGGEERGESDARHVRFQENVWVRESGYYRRGTWYTWRGTDKGPAWEEGKKMWA